MTRDIDIERVLDRFYADGPSEMPDRVFLGVVDRVERVPQRRLAYQMTRFANMNRNLRLAAAAAIVVAVVGVTAFAISRSPDIGNQPTPTATPTASQTATPTPLATPSPLPEGTYRTAPIPTATLKATAEAAGFTWDAVTPDGGNMATDYKNVKTTVNTIRLLNGEWAWFCASDGATDELCAQGTYTVTDDHTVAYTDAQNPSSGFKLTFSLDGDVLTTHVDPAGPDCAIQCVTFYNSAPFVRQP